MTDKGESPEEGRRWGLRQWAREFMDENGKDLGPFFERKKSVKGRVKLEERE